MREFIEANPGLKSRFDRHYEFQDYSADELFTIALSLLEREGLNPSPAALEHLQSYLGQLYQNRDKYFGNARTVRQIIGEAVKNQHLRMAAMDAEKRTKEVLHTLALEDVAEFVVKEEKSRATMGYRYGGK
jgi:hypothetical protein